MDRLRGWLKDGPFTLVLGAGGLLLLGVVAFFVWDALTYRATPYRAATATPGHGDAVPRSTPAPAAGTPAPTATPTPVARVPAPTATPTPDPRGRILFKSNEGSRFRGTLRWRIYVMNPDGTGRRRATKEEEELYEHAVADLGWKSDRLYRAFVRKDGTGRPQVWVEFLQDRTSWQASKPGSGITYSPAWQPGGELIACVSTEAGEDDIYTMRMDGSDWRRLTGPNNVWDKHPAWSPDGRQIIWWSMQGTGRRQIWAMDADGANQRNVSNSPYDDWDPVWVR